jgi:hypothetical protein
MWMQSSLLIQSSGCRTESSAVPVLVYYLAPQLLLLNDLLEEVLRCGNLTLPMITLGAGFALHMCIVVMLLVKYVGDDIDTIHLLKIL